jgi:2-keto-3-deoxy-L-fuconate dehydrogenase
MTDFDGLAALVTGGASGIGAATVALLRGRGARVASLDLQAGDDKTADLTITCDVTDPASVDGAVAAVHEHFGRLDVVINNAGIGAVGDITANSDAEWRRVLDVNVIGIARVTRAALPHLRRSPHAVVVNTCSVAAPVGVPQRALYSASKGAVAALTLAMAADHVAEGIRVNAVTPGTAETPWVTRLLNDADDPAAAGAALRARQPIGRLVSAAEVAFAIAYLASPLAASTTGTLLAVDGGMASLRLPGAPPAADPTG